ARTRGASMSAGEQGSPQHSESHPAHDAARALRRWEGIKPVATAEGADGRHSDRVKEEAAPRPREPGRGCGGPGDPGGRRTGVERQLVHTLARAQRGLPTGLAVLAAPGRW